MAWSEFPENRLYGFNYNQFGLSQNELNTLGNGQSLYNTSHAYDSTYPFGISTNFRTEYDEDLGNAVISNRWNERAYTFTLTITLNGVGLLTTSENPSATGFKSDGFFFIFNDDTHKARIGVYYATTDNHVSFYSISSENENLYNWLKGGITPTYNFAAIHTLLDRGNSINLSMLKPNDGTIKETVLIADNVISFSNNTNLDNIISTMSPGDEKVLFSIGRTIKGGNDLVIVRNADLTLPTRRSFTLKYLIDGIEQIDLTTDYVYEYASGTFEVPYFSMLQAEKEGVLYSKPSVIFVWDTPQGRVYCDYNTEEEILVILPSQLEKWTRWLTPNEDKSDDPYEDSEDTPEGGGYGEFSYETEDTDFTPTVTQSASDSGFCTIYKITESDIKDLADYLWSIRIEDFLPIFDNPMDCIISIGLLPIEAETSSPSDIMIGNLNSGVNGQKVTEQFIDYDLGSIEVGMGEYSNSFMDYSPYVSATLFLPYIGSVELDVDEIMDSLISLTYHIDILTGSCVAEVKIKKDFYYSGSNHTHTNILYRFAGNMLTPIPVCGRDFSQMFSAMMSSIARFGLGVVSSGTLAVAAGAIGGLSGLNGMKSSVAKSNTTASTIGIMGSQKAELHLKLPKIATLGEAEGETVGYPRYGVMTINELSGYTEIDKIHLTGLSCNDIERSLIENIFKTGVIFSGTGVPSKDTTTGKIIIYRYDCEKSCANKADDWTELDSDILNWRTKNVNVVKPTILITPNSNLNMVQLFTEANYVYLADFRRYYYIVDITAMAGGYVEIVLEVDAVMTWLSDLKPLKCIVDRNQKNWNTYLKDDNMRMFNNPYNLVKVFPQTFDTPNFYAVIAGGEVSGSTNERVVTNGE